MMPVSYLSLSDTGASKLITDGNIQVYHGEIQRLSQSGVILKDGTTHDFDAVVFATGYHEATGALQAVLGEEMASRCIWQRGIQEALYGPLDEEGLVLQPESVINARTHGLARRKCNKVARSSSTKSIPCVTTVRSHQARKQSPFTQDSS